MNFIIGRGRSGSKLLSGVLNSMPGIAVAPESFYLLHLAKEFHGKVFNQSVKLSFLNKLTDDIRLSTWLVVNDDFKNQFLESNISNFHEACDFITKYFSEKVLRKPGKTTLIDKNPHYTFYVKELLKIYPKAKFLILVRNPIENVNSYKRVPFDSDIPEVLAYEWNAFYDCLNTVLDKVLTKEQYRVIQYEQLVRSPELEVQKTCEFLGVQFSDNFLKEGTIEKSEFSWHKNVSSEITFHTSVTLTQKEQEQVANVTYKTASLFGYDLGEITTSSRISVINKIRGGILVYLTSGFYSFPYFIRKIVLQHLRKKLLK